MADNEEVQEIDYDRVLYRCPIASPLSNGKPKLTKKLYSLIRKSVTSQKRGVIKGIKDVTKAVRKGHKGLVVLGADISPYDVISHLPIMLEEAEIPYIWVPSRQDLGTATNCKRATSVVLLKPKPDIEASYSKCLAAIEELKNATE